MDTLSAFKEFSVERMDNAKEAVAPSKNQSVLDGLGEDSDGNLTYKGEPIASTKPSLPPIEAVVDNDSYVAVDFNSQTMSFEALNIPVNARVIKVEIPDIVNQTDEYIQLEDMVAKDPMGIASPYFVIYPKNAQNVFTIAAVVAFPIVGNSFFDAASGFAFSGKTIKIYYEIEE